MTRGQAIGHWRTRAALRFDQLVLGDVPDLWPAMGPLLGRLEGSQGSRVDLLGKVRWKRPGRPLAAGALIRLMRPGPGVRPRLPVPRSVRRGACGAVPP